MKSLITVLKIIIYFVVWIPTVVVWVIFVLLFKLLSLVWPSSMVVWSWKNVEVRLNAHKELF